MALKELDNSNINKHLGKSSEYASNYDPSLLQTQRARAREPEPESQSDIRTKQKNMTTKKKEAQPATKKKTT